MFDYVDGAAGREIAAARNVSAFDGIALQPRVLENVAGRSLKTEFLGRGYTNPFGIAPMGMCNLTWPDADRMLAYAAHALGIPLAVSSFASTTIGEMRRWAGENAWFQLYINQDPDAALGLVDRVEEAGYEVLILTVDVPQVSRRVRDVRNGFRLPFRMGPRQILDFALHPRWSIATLLKGAPRVRSFSTGNEAYAVDRSASRAAADWHFLDRLRQRWAGRLIVKGVTCGSDAQRIRDAGADAVYVSNHGGRQLDSGPSAISVLPRIRSAVGADYPLVFDGGVRSGEDIARALALGADFVMLGRPALYAIGADGERGLFSLLKIMAEELDLTLAQLGLTDVSGLLDAVLTEAPDKTGTG